VNEGYPYGPLSLRQFSIMSTDLESAEMIKYLPMHFGDQINFIIRNRRAL